MDLYLQTSCDFTACTGITFLLRRKGTYVISRLVRRHGWWDTPYKGTFCGNSSPRLSGVKILGDSWGTFQGEKCLTRWKKYDNFYLVIFILAFLRHITRVMRKQQRVLNILEGILYKSSISSNACHFQETFQQVTIMRIVFREWVSRIRHEAVVQW